METKKPLLMRVVFIALSLILFLCVEGKSQIINIESKRLPSDTIGWSGSLGVSFRISKDRSDIFAFNNDGHIQFKADRHLLLYLQDISFLRANSTNFENGGFFHIRYNYKWNPNVRLESFTQFQFNSLVSVDRRFLLGFGPRFKLSQSEKYKFYLAILYMREWEQITRDMPDPDRPTWDNKDNRISSYLSFTIKPTSSFKIISTTYFQPLVDKLDDIRIHNESQLRFSITSNFSFSTTFRLSFDTEPPANVPKTVYRLTNGFSYSFN